MKVSLIIRMLFFVVVFGLASCATTPAKKDYHFSKTSWMWQNQKINLISAKERLKNQEQYGLFSNGKKLLPTKYKSIKLVGNTIFAQPSGTGRDIYYIPFSLSLDGNEVELSQKDTSHFVEVYSLNSKGNLAGYAKEYASHQLAYKDRGSQMHNWNPANITLLNAQGDSIAYLPEAYSGPVEYGTAWKQRADKGYIFLDHDGRPLGPPLKGLLSDKWVSYIPMDEAGLVLPVLKTGRLPGETTGFLGYQRIGPASRGPRYWISHYNVDGKRQYGYASADLAFSSGPLWSDWKAWRMAETPVQVYGQFVYYPQDEAFVARSVQDNQWRMYKTKEYGDTRPVVGMPPVINGPAATSNAVIKAQETDVKQRHQLMMAEIQLKHTKQLARLKAKQAELAAHQAKIQKIRDQEVANQAKLREQGRIKRAPYLASFEQALAAGDKKQAEALVWRARGDSYCQYLMKFEPNARPHLWSRAKSMSESSNMTKACTAKYEQSVQKSLEYAEQEANRKARLEAEARSRPYIPTFDWNSFWNAAHTSQAIQSKNQASGNNNKTNQVQSYTESLRKFTYGEQDWHYTSPQ